MATKTKCQPCGVRLWMRLPPHAQTFQCPVCRGVTRLRPTNHPGALGPPVRPAPPPMLPHPPPAYGRKKALLCGLSYYGQQHFLGGSLNDVKRMRFFLQDQMGFPPDCIVTLTEDERDPMKIPTKRNMIMALRWLSQGCRPGDSLVFYYTGHGSQVPDDSMDEIDGYDEALCPVDFETAGKLLDDDINALIVNPLPRGAKLHAIIDTCFSGTVLDLPFVCKKQRGGYGYNWEDHTLDMNAYGSTRGGLAVCISACADDESSANTTIFTGDSTGALTYSFIQAVASSPSMTYGHLLNALSYSIHDAKSQHANARAGEPQISSSEVFDINTRQFAL